MSRELSLASPSSLRDGLYKLWRKFTGAFSETAGKTGQFWIDDKPIYRKVVDLGALPNATTKDVAHGLTGIGEVVDLRVVANDSATGAFVKATLQPSEADGLTMDVTNVKLSTAADMTAYDQAYAIIDYTLA